MLTWLKRSRGFTLIEIAIVVAIIGLLLIISLPLFSGARNRAYIAEGRVILSEGKSLLWGCLVEKNFVDASCDSFAKIGWTTRPFSDVWNTGAGTTLTMATNCAEAVTAGTHRIKIVGDGDPVLATAYVCIEVIESNGRVTEVLSGL